MKLTVKEGILNPLSFKDLEVEGHREVVPISPGNYDVELGMKKSHQWVFLQGTLVGLPLLILRRRIECDAAHIILEDC